MRIYVDVTLIDYESEFIIASKLEIPASELFNENAKDFEYKIMEHLKEKHIGEDSFNHRFYNLIIKYKNKNILVEYEFYYNKIIEIKLGNINFEEQYVFSIPPDEFYYNKYSLYSNWPISINRIYDINNNEIQENKFEFERIAMHVIRKKCELIATDEGYFMHMIDIHPGICTIKRIQSWYNYCLYLARKQILDFAVRMFRYSFQ